MERSHLKYIKHYPDHILNQVEQLIEKNALGSYLKNKYPESHQINNEKMLYQFTLDIKNTYMRQSQPLSKVRYDDKVDVIHNALGLHKQVSRVQGNKLKSKREIQIASVFKKAPIEFLTMIVVHELAHFKEKEHNKAFYKLCQHMEPDYHQLELDLRLYLTYLAQPDNNNLY